MSTAEEKQTALRMREQGYRDGFHGHERRYQDGRYLTAYRRGRDRREQIEAGRTGEE